MRNKLSARFNACVILILNKGLAKNKAEIARRLGVTQSTLSMAMSGEREPTWDLLLSLCDHYPINFWWLRSGQGPTWTPQTEVLLARIEELENALKNGDK